MATLLSSRPRSYSTLPATIHVELARITTLKAAPQGWADISASQITEHHWSPAQQDGLLESLAPISQGNTGWILIANAPAPLSRLALLNAGVNPARVIDAKQASAELIQQAINCKSIAAVVCWKGTQITSRFLKGFSDDNDHLLTH